MKFNNILYFSTNTFLAFQINEIFYNGEHFVWCAPVFDPLTLEKYDIRRKIPPSSSPHKIYITLKEDIEGQDLHSAKIESARNGIKKGALIQFENNVINEQELAIITELVDKAKLEDFRPLVYIVPKQLVETRIKSVSVDSKANPLSVEFNILDLKRNEFEIIEFK